MCLWLMCPGAFFNFPQHPKLREVHNQRFRRECKLAIPQGQLLASVVPAHCATLMLPCWQHPQLARPPTLRQHAPLPMQPLATVALARGALLKLSVLQELIALGEVGHLGTLQAFSGRMAALLQVSNMRDNGIAAGCLSRALGLTLLHWLACPLSYTSCAWPCSYQNAF